VAGLKVLQATIYEGMRIYPPVPAGLQRIVPKGGATIAGYSVPEGVSKLHDFSILTRPSFLYLLTE
jgi:cytochrome P450